MTSQITVQNAVSKITKLFSSEGSKNTNRFSDFGPLEIEDHKKFLQSSKAFFEKQWSKRSTQYKEKLDDFQILAAIKSGTFGDIVLAKSVNIGEKFALKIVKKELIVKKNLLRHALCEKLVLEGLNCPFTIYLVSFFMDNSYLYFVLPLIPSGHLLMYLEQFGKFEEIIVMFYAAQAVLGLEYLHYLNIVYRGLTPENLLLDHLGYVRLSDFSFCKRIHARTYTFCGTLEYLAPEVVKNKGYGLASDWWSLGVLLYELTAGRSPFYSEYTVRLYKSIVGCSYSMDNELFSADLQDLIGNLLQSDLTKRFGNLKNGVADIKNHIWFRPIHWLAVLNRTTPALFIPTRKTVEDGDKDQTTLKLFPQEVDTEDKYRDEFASF